MYFIFTYVNESDKIRKSILIPNVKVFISLKGGGGFLYFKIKCKQFLCIHNKQYILINKLYELRDMSMCKFFTIGDLAYKTIY